MSTKHHVTAFLAALALAGCTPGSNSDSSSGATKSQLSQPDGGAANIDLHDCRLYIEKAGVDYAAHNDAIDLYLRTEDGFDSSIASIKFYGVQTYSEDGSNFSNDVALDVQEDDGGSDAWHIQLATTGDNDVAIGNTNQHGVFGVTTVNGTHYWLRSSDGSDFWINDQLFQNLDQSQLQLGVSVASDESGISPSPDNAIYTQYDFPYLDPNGC
jgi:hypothetical protein